MNRSKVISIALGVVLCMFVSASSSQARETIKIGVYLPMAGTVASYGEMCWSGIQMANSMEPEVAGKQIELILVDTKSDAVESANAVTLLVEKKVSAIIGEAISADTMAGNPISEAAKIPTVSPVATSPLVTQGKKYAFRACFIDPFQGEVAARFAIEHLKAKTASLIIDQAQDYSVGLGNFFAREFEKQGGKIVSKTYIQTGDQDFSAQLSSIQSSKPEIVYAPIYYTEDALLARQARDLGIDRPILTGDGAQVDELLKVGGNAVEGMYFTGHFHREAASTERAKEFIKRYEEKYKKEANAFSALGADAYFLILDAVKRAGSTDGEKIRDALAATKDFKAVSGTVTMGPDGNPIKSMVINRVHDGKFVYVTTINP